MHTRVHPHSSLDSPPDSLLVPKHIMGVLQRVRGYPRAHFVYPVKRLRVPHQRHGWVSSKHTMAPSQQTVSTAHALRALLEHAAGIAQTRSNTPKHAASSPPFRRPRSGGSSVTGTPTKPPEILCLQRITRSSGVRLDQVCDSSARVRGAISARSAIERQTGEAS